MSVINTTRLPSNITLKPNIYAEARELLFSSISTLRRAKHILLILSEVTLKWTHSLSRADWAQDYPILLSQLKCAFSDCGEVLVKTLKKAKYMKWLFVFDTNIGLDSWTNIALDSWTCKGVYTVYWPLRFQTGPSSLQFPLVVLLWFKWCLIKISYSISCIKPLLLFSVRTS